MRSKQEIEWQKSEVIRKRIARSKRNDQRPVCDCNAYSFPHKIGGKCKGQAFAEFYFYNQKDACSECNCLNDAREPISCDVINGTESIKEAECYRDAVHYHPSEHLQIQINWSEESE